MKKNLILKISTVIFIIIASSYFYMKNIEAKKKLIVTQPVSVASLRESLVLKKVNVEGACANPSLLGKDIIDLSNPDLKTRFTYLCEDLSIAKKLEENFSTNTDYSYFLNCAKMHTTNMQQITSDLKEHYSEDYKKLNFSKENQESILLKYLKHPNTAYLMAQCEAKAEALYWRSIINSGKVEDLKFCLQTTEDCIGGKSKPEECPANFQSYHDECSKKLNSMKH
jgi:hypothetical protein